MISNLLLDLDGTLVDSSRGIYHSFVLACDNFSLSPPNYTSFCHLIGPPIQKIATQLFPDLDLKTIEEFRRIFRLDYDNLSYKMYEWYPGVVDTIKELSTCPGISMSIVTNKPSLPALELIKSSGLRSCFSQIVGIDYLSVFSNGPVFSSKSEALSHVLLSSPVDLLKSAYVGDTLNDLDACKRCNLQFIAALYGFHRWHHQQMPPRCIAHFGEVQSFLR